VLVGHFTDRQGWTGCTVILCPPGSVGSGEVRGGGPGTRESSLLSPAAAAPGVDALVLSGGSAFGLASTDGVVTWLAARGVGYPTPAGPVPLVAGAVVFDLMLGDSGAHPDASAGQAACEAASRDVERGSVGVGTGCTVGKLLGTEGWTKGGFGAATIRADGATLTALAAVNPFGEVVGEDGRVIAGVWREDRYVPTRELFLEGVRWRTAREATTLACVLTDAMLAKADAWVLARSASAGVAHAVRPSGTAVDGDAVFAIATGAVEADPLVLGALAADVVAEAIRDGVRSATGAPSCPAAGERLPWGHPGVGGPDPGERRRPPGFAPR
jgi:L-aminopeptidase/D-esterase-like protein